MPRWVPIVVLAVIFLLASKKKAPAVTDQEVGRAELNKLEAELVANSAAMAERYYTAVVDPSKLLVWQVLYQIGLAEAEVIPVPLAGKKYADMPGALQRLRNVRQALKDNGDWSPKDWKPAVNRRDESPVLGQVFFPPGMKVWQVWLSVVSLLQKHAPDAIQREDAKRVYTAIRMKGLNAKNAVNVPFLRNMLREMALDYMEREDQRL